MSVETELVAYGRHEQYLRLPIPVGLKLRFPKNSGVQIGHFATCGLGGAVDYSFSCLYQVFGLGPGMNDITVEHVDHLALLEATPDVRSVFICDIDVEDLSSPFEKLTRLERLIIRDCPNLRELPASLQNMASLEYLRLEDNNELDLSGFDFEKFTKLTAFHALGIASETLDKSLAECKKLNTLMISECKHLKELPVELSELKKLKALSVTQNRALKNFPFNKKQLKKMQPIDLHSNPKIELPDYLASSRNTMKGLSPESQSFLRRYFDRSDRSIQDELRMVINDDGHLFPSWWRYEIEHELTGAMRVSAFRGDLGATLVFETISYSPSKGGLAHGGTHFSTFSSLNASTLFWLENSFYHDLIEWDQELHETMPIELKGKEITINIDPKFAERIQSMKNSDGVKLPPEAVLLFAVCDQVDRDDLFESPAEIKKNLDLPDDAQLLFKLDDWNHSHADNENPSEGGELPILIEALERGELPKVEGSCSWRQSWKDQWTQD